MHSMKAFILLLMFTGIGSLLADEVTITLQNGKDGYDGCMDSYLYRQIDDTTYQHQNHGGEVSLQTYYCPT